MTEQPPDIDALFPLTGPERVSERGRLLPPDLDDRRWQDLVDEAVVRIKKRAPQWTDQNPSDIGMALVELFAWLTETLIYRLNRVPEKQYVAFLGLLGITRAPQNPARTLLTFTARPGTAEIPAGTPVQTPGTEAVPPVVFETDAALLGSELAAAGTMSIALPKGAARVYKDVSKMFAGDTSAALAVDLGIDDAIQLCLGLAAQPQVPALFDVYVEPFRSAVDTTLGQNLEWVYSAAEQLDPARWPTLEVISDATAGLTRAGLVRLRLPPGANWATQDTTKWPAAPTHSVTTAARWLGVRVARQKDPLDPATNPPRLRLRLDRMLLGTTTASAVATVKNEVLGLGDGTPHQVFGFAQRPIYARPFTDRPYDHVTVTVGGATWTAVDFLPDRAGTSYLLDPVSGEITFGDHDAVAGTGQGTVPTPGQRIEASYRYVSAGANGNVPAGLLHVPTANVTGVTGVVNPIPAGGGTDEEPIEETKRRAPELLRHGDRAVTAEDYEALALTASSDIASVRCLAPRLTGGASSSWWTYGDLQRTPGKVNLIVVPDLGPGTPRPEPSLALSREVHRVLDRRRDVTAELAVRGPRYVPVGIKVTVQVFQRAKDDGLISGKEDVHNAVRKNIEKFLHPVYGGRSGAGWAVGESVFESDVYQAIRPADHLGYISALDLVLEKPLYFLPGAVTGQRPVTDVIDKDAKQVRIFDYELVCQGSITITGELES
ncbi:putative baseplate assembly protein [Kribbella sp. NPDC055110]